jgi:hypothetical protein
MVHLAGAMNLAGEQGRINYANPFYIEGVNFAWGRSQRNEF